MIYKMLRFTLLSILAMLWGKMSAEQETQVTLDFTNTQLITELGFTLPEEGKGTDITESFTYNGITITPYAGSTPVRIWNSSGAYTLRYYKADNNGNKGGIEISVPENNSITQIVITGNTQLENTICGTGTIEMSGNKKTLTWTPEDGSPTGSVKFENNGDKTTNVETITVTYEGAGTSDDSHCGRLTAVALGIYHHRFGHAA